MPSPTKGASSPDRSKVIEASFRALEERFNEYSALPNADVSGGKATAPAWAKGAGGPPAPPAPGTVGPKAKSGVDFKVSKRIMNEVSYVNQHRQPKGVEATLEWHEVVDLSGAAAPSARVGMSLTRLGWGEHARLVLFGGYEEHGYASSDLHYFDPLAMCWLDEAEAGSTLGKSPPPRAGHTANGFGRHTMLVFGGRGEAGLLDELWALQMYRSKPSAGQPPRTAFCWLQQHVADEYGNAAGPSARAYHAVAEVEEGGNQGLMLFGGEVIMRSGEKDMLVKLLEQRQGLSHSKAAALIAQGAAASSLQSATMPVLGARDRTDMIGATRFEPPAREAAPSPQRPRTSSAKPGRRGLPPPLSPKMTPGSSRGPSPFPATPQGATPSVSRPDTAGPDTASGTPDRFGRDKPKPRTKSPNPNLSRRPLSPPDRRLVSELKVHRRDGSPSGYTPPPSGLRKGGGLTPSGLSGAGMLSGGGGTAAEVAARKRERWVHHPTSELWRLRGRSGGRLQWSAVETAGGEPFPRSRHVFCGVPARKLCLLSGGRSVKANTVLSDLWALDVPGTVWARLELVGVPAAPRENGAGLALGASLFVFGGRGRTCRADGCLFHLNREARAGALLDSSRDGGVAETLGAWEHPTVRAAVDGATPGHRQGHVLARVGSDAVVLFGGHCTDDDSWPECVPQLGRVTSAGPPGGGGGQPLALERVSPASADVCGGEELVLHGRGFRDGASTKIKFVVPSRAPPPPKGAAAARRAPLQMRPAREERCVIVAAEVINRTSVRCVLPDMSTLLCDGPVLVEAGLQVGGPGESWSADERQLELTSKCDTARLRLSGGGMLGGVAGEEICYQVTTFDVAGRRRGTRGDVFACVLRKPGVLEEGAEPQLVAAEVPPRDNGDGTYDLLYLIEKAGTFTCVLSLDALMVKELDVEIVAGPIEAKACDLVVTSPLANKGAPVTVKAGGELSFKLAPRDRFGNDASAADDAAPSTFSWQLVMTKAAPRFIEPEPEEPSKKGMNEKELAAAAEAALALLPPERKVFGQAFDHLEQTSPSLIEAGEYELRVTHRPPRGGENLVRIIPVVVTAAEMSPVHCTLSGSALHSCKGDGFSSGERECLLICRDEYGNRILEGGNGLKPNTPAELNVELKNQHPDGGAEPRAEWGAGGVEGPGVYRLGYGVRVQGTFLLSIKLMGEDVLERLVTVSAEAVEGDNEERWAEEFSLARAQAAQRLLEEEAARQLEEARLAAEAEERRLLEVEWRGVRAEMKTFAFSVPAPCERLLQLHYKKLKALVADFAAPEDHAALRAVKVAAKAAAEAAAAPDDAALQKAAKKAAATVAEMPECHPRLSLRSWSLMTRLTGLVQHEHGRGRAQVGALFAAASALAPPKGAPAAAAAEGAEAAAEEAAPPDAPAAAAAGFEPPLLSLAASCGLFISMAALMAAGGDAEQVATQLTVLLEEKLLPLAVAAEEFPGWPHHQPPIAWPPPAGKEDTGVPPWGDDGGNTARGGTCWISIYDRREDLQAQYATHLAAELAVARLPPTDAAAPAADAAAAKPPSRPASAAPAGPAPDPADIAAVTAASTISAQGAMALLAKYPELLAPPLTPELAMRIFKEVQPEAVAATHPADYAYSADFAEWLTVLWRCVRLRFSAEKDGGQAAEEWMHTKACPTPEMIAAAAAAAAKAEDKGKGAKKKGK